jgi:hypothetical protein
MSYDSYSAIERSGDVVKSVPESGCRLTAVGGMDPGTSEDMMSLAKEVILAPPDVVERMKRLMAG